MTAYYNELDPYAAAWLRNLIAAGHIAPGDVDERSIVDVRPDDLRGYTQCHFFAGIGGWSYALRRAGWDDARPVWTGSCPCQPFSAAGKGKGFDDERHLWPVWYELIRECRPAVLFGEQVASKDADPWIDLVQADLEALDYAVGAVPFPAAGVGSPNIRDRNYWLGHTDATGKQRRHRKEGSAASQGEREVGQYDGQRVRPILRGTSNVGRMAYANGGDAGAERQQCSGQQRQQPQDGGVSVMADTALSGRREKRADVGRLVVRDRAQGITTGSSAGGGDLWPGPLNGFWADADWLLCRDGKWRPVEPGTFPLAHGAASRVGRLRAYGNAINAEAAITFIEAADGAMSE